VHEHKYQDNRPAFHICVWQADMILKFGNVIPFRNNKKRDRWERWYPYLQAVLRKGGKSVDRVEKVTSLGKMQTIGLEITNTHNYVTGDVVTHNTTRWLKREKLPYGSHVQQLNIYAALLRAQGREVTSAAIQYIDLSGPSKCPTCKGPVAPGADGVMVCQRCGRTLPNAHPGVAIVEVALEDNNVVAEWIQTRLKILEMAIESGEAPDAEVGYLCDYCAFQQKCANE
jgi:CRISPR/Cas system-associated exonuclease Cas4 (RecB family)